MKTTKKFQLLMLATSSLCALGSLSSCKDDHDHDEGEVITTVKLICQDSANASLPVSEFRFEDPDGPGGNNPTRLDTIYLDSGRTTLVSLRFEDASSGTVKDISAEVRSEADEHLVCFGPAGIQLAINITDTDGMYPLGLESRWKPQASGSGSITVTLKHQYDVKNGTCDPGDTDVEVTFPVIIR
jgi:hypothetical protein